MGKRQGYLSWEWREQREEWAQEKSSCVIETKTAGGCEEGVLWVGTAGKFRAAGEGFCHSEEPSGLDVPHRYRSTSTRGVWKLAWALISVSGEGALPGRQKLSSQVPEERWEWVSIYSPASLLLYALPLEFGTQRWQYDIGIFLTFLWWIFI